MGIPDLLKTPFKPKKAPPPLKKPLFRLKKLVFPLFLIYYFIFLWAVLTLKQFIPNNQMINYHLFEIRFKSGSNGSAKVQITSLWWSESVVINYDYSKNDIGEIAKSYLENLGFDFIAKSESAKATYLISTNFNYLKK
jgi:hypothetical protein